MAPTQPRWESSLSGRSSRLRRHRRDTASGARTVSIGGTGPVGSPKTDSVRSNCGVAPREAITREAPGRANVECEDSRLHARVLGHDRPHSVWIGIEYGQAVNTAPVRHRADDGE